MINEKIINIAITNEQKEKVRQNSASSLPLNPTAQGWSAQKIREKLYRAICSDTGDLDDNLLDIIVDKLLSVQEVFEALQSGEFVVKKAELFEDVENGKSTYANKLDLVYSSSNNRIAITLKSSDGTTLDADLIDLPKATTSADGLLSKEDKYYLDIYLPTQLASKENKDAKNQINGYAGLDSNAKIPSSLLPDSILGQLVYMGVFNPNNGYPSSPEKGWYYISTHNGTANDDEYHIGDWAVYNGASWDKVDNTDAVMSVNGKLGVVVLNGTDIPVGNGDTWTVEQRIVNIYAELNDRYTKEEVDNLLENYETSANSSKIYYNETKPSEWTKNDLWFHLIGE